MNSLEPYNSISFYFPFKWNNKLGLGLPEISQVDYDM